MQIQNVELRTQDFAPFRALLGDEEYLGMLATAKEAKRVLGERIWWNVHSTAQGGGGAEMLQTHLAYARGLGIDARWLVIEGEADFFAVTKRLHHALHGADGDGSDLGEAERVIYERTLAGNAALLCKQIRSGDIVLLHDPQSAGLAPALQRHGVTVVWRSHIGDDKSNVNTLLGWAFIAPYLHQVSAAVFSRSSYVPPELQQLPIAIIAPSIDPFSAKNQEMSDAVSRAILRTIGIIEGEAEGTPATFIREDGTVSMVQGRATVVPGGRLPTVDTPLVVQVSRWDPLKDPIGIIHGFAALLSGPDPVRADLLLAGPDVGSVADDPEAPAVLQRTIASWLRLPLEQRERIHLVTLPMSDREENAAMVNALQRHAAIIVQKSMHEGFGLTVTEAMWKARPLIASAVGGIQDQIRHGKEGFLLKDPSDLEGFGEAIRILLDEPSLAHEFGRQARLRVLNEFLVTRHLRQYAELLTRLEQTKALSRSPQNGEASGTV